MLNPCPAQAELPLLPSAAAEGDLVVLPGGRHYVRREVIWPLDGRPFLALFPVEDA